MLPLLKVIDAPIQIPNVFDLTVSFKFLNFSSQICLLCVPKMSANFASYSVQIRNIRLKNSLVYKKVKQSHYRSGGAHRVPGS